MGQTDYKVGQDGITKWGKMGLQSGAAFWITKWGKWITKWGRDYIVGQKDYNVGQGLQSGASITKWGSTYDFLRHRNFRSSQQNGSAANAASQQEIYTFLKRKSGTKSISSLNRF